MASQLFVRMANSNGTDQNVLEVATDQLQPWVHSPQSQALLARQPGRDVAFAHGSIVPGHIDSHRQSYVNAILIQSRGVALSRACDQCLKRTATGRKRIPAQRFLDCRVVKGYFGGCCASCKWSDAANKCSYVWDDLGRESGYESDTVDAHRNLPYIKEEDVREEVREAYLEFEWEEGEIRYESANDECESQGKEIKVEESDILQKLLLPEYPKPADEKIKKTAFSSKR